MVTCLGLSPPVSAAVWSSSPWPLGMRGGGVWRGEEERKPVEVRV